MKPTSLVHRFNSINYKFYTVFIPLFLLSMISCKKDPANIVPSENKLVILAEITAEETAYIPVTATRDAGSGDEISFSKINDASVSIAQPGEMEKQLLLNQSADFAGLPASIYSAPFQFKPNSDYSLRVTHALLGTDTATTHIPSAFNVTNVTTEESSLHGKDVLNFNFEIEDNANEKNYFVFEAVKQIVHVSHYFFWQGKKYDYDTQEGKDLFETLEDEDENVVLLKDTIPTKHYLRLRTYTNDNHTENKAIGNIDSSFRRVFITDSTFNGQLYSTSISVIMDQFESINPQDKGIVMIRIKSVDKVFFNYLLQYEKYKTDFGKMPIGELAIPTGNIQNGLGIFGGSYKREWKFYYDDLE